MQAISSRERITLAASIKYALIIAAVSSTLPQPAFADANSSLTLDEIIVTARKREESIQKTPVAVTAFSAETLEARNVDSIDKVSQFTPNLQFDGAAALSGGRFNATMFIRGVGQNDFATFSESGVGMYVDGIYMGRTIGGIMDAVDLARVEVLRGPQGTLFGKNTIGGAINIVTVAPSDQLGGDISYTGGQFNRADLKASVNLPLADGKFLTRWSVARMTRDGYAKQIDFLTGKTEERGDHNAEIARIQNIWHVNENFSASLDLDGTRVREHAAPLTLVRVTPPGPPFLLNFNNLVAPNATFGYSAINAKLATLGAAPGVTNFWITNDPYTTYGNFYNVNTLDSWGAGLTLDWNLGATKLKSITGYRKLRADFGRDGDNSPYTFRETFNTDSAKQLSQEFQLSGLSFNDRLDWLVGAYYFKEDTIDDGGARLGVGVYQATGSTNPGFDLQIQLYNVNVSQSYAAFAQATYKITDRFSVTPGIRYTQDKKEFTGFQRRLNTVQTTGDLPYIIPPDFSIDASWSVVNPKLSFEFQATDDILLYVSAANGYKAGGFNERPLGNKSEVNTYEPEKMWSYELGAKTSWFDRRVTLNTAVFYSDYKDIQLTVNQTPLNFVFNAAAGEIKGAELELNARLARGLDFNLAVGHTSAGYTEIDASRCPSLAACPITTNHDFVKTPKWTTSSGLQYGFDAGSGSSLTLRGDWAYKAFTYQDVGNDPAIAQPGYSVFNARVAWLNAKGDWEIAVFGTNLGDKRYTLSGNAASAAFGSLAESTYAPPREWGATVHYKF